MNGIRERRGKLLFGWWARFFLVGLRNASLIAWPGIFELIAWLCLSLDYTISVISATLLCENRLLRITVQG